MFKVKLSESVEKFIDNLDGSIKVRVRSYIDSLEVDPNPRSGKHIIDISGNVRLCEGSVDKLRFYYTIENEFVVIEEIIDDELTNVEYEGIVKVTKAAKNHKSGNKQNNPNQRRDIAKLKKEFKTKF